MTRIFHTTLLLLVLGMGNLSAGEKVSATGSFDRPPFQFLDTKGNPSGFDVEVFKAAAEAVGLETTFYHDPNRSPEQTLVDGVCEAIVGRTSDAPVDPAITQALPHHVLDHTLYVKKSSLIRGLGDLRQKSVAAVRSSSAETYLASHGFASQLAPAPTAEEALKLVVDGKVDAALVETVVAEHSDAFRVSRSVRNATEAIAPVGYGFAVSSDISQLRNKLEEGMRIIKKTGQYNRIASEFLTPEAIAESGPSPAFVTLLGFGGILLISGVVISIRDWQRTALARIQRLQGELKNEKHSFDDLRATVARQQFVLNRMSTGSLVDEVLKVSASRPDEEPKSEDE